MKADQESPYAALEKIFHEPNRLAIMSNLCSASEGLTFTELKQECGLTDGNLSRHLKALEESKVVRIKKYFKGVKPQTRVLLTEKGRESFLDYLKALEEVLHKAAKGMIPEKKMQFLPWGKPTQA